LWIEDLVLLETHLKAIWHRHWEKIRIGGSALNQNRTASDVYDCWPSVSWFREAALPFRDQIAFETGDSSYNIWVFDIQVALPLLGRIICDLYLRMTWPKGPLKSRSGSQVSCEDEFVELLAAKARKAVAQRRREEAFNEAVEGQESKDEDSPVDLFFDNWEFRMRPLWQLMEQIWWPLPREARIDEAARRWPFIQNGPLAPRRPQPQQGLSLLKGQESVFLTWDRFELWVYGCYVD